MNKRGPSWALLESSFMEEASPTHTFEIKYSKTNLPVPVIDGIYLHSIHNPVKEAEGLISRYEKTLEESNHILLFGLGFAYHLHQIDFKLRTIYGESYQIFVIEPNSHIYKDCLERDLCPLREQIQIFSKETIEEYFLDKELIHFMSRSPAVISHPTSFTLHQSFFKKFMDYKANSEIPSVTNFIENKNLKNHLKGNYTPYTIEKTFDTILEQPNLVAWDYLLLSFKEISADRSMGN